MITIPKEIVKAHKIKKGDIVKWCPKSERLEVEFE